MIVVIMVREGAVEIQAKLVMTLGIPLLLASLFFLLRLVLIIVGLHKGPVLEMFEKYGDEEPFFFPLPQLVGWFGAAMFAVGLITGEGGRGFNVGTVAGAFVLCLAYVLFSSKERLQSRLSTLPTIPMWLGRLNENTSRYERRRIAYMWLHLPLRTRLLYNASDRFFFLWADLVIMATVRES